MRIVELLNNITLPITNEEADLLDKLNTSDFLLKMQLDEREQLVASSLVNKDVVLRFHQDGKVAYKKRIK